MDTVFVCLCHFLIVVFDFILFLSVGNKPSSCKQFLGYLRNLQFGPSLTAQFIRAHIPTSIYVHTSAYVHMYFDIKLSIKQTLL